MNYVGAGEMMLQEQRLSKKNKPRKIPQRGLGVAQLEKLRLAAELEQSKNAALSSSNLTAPLISPHHHEHHDPLRSPIPPSLAMPLENSPVDVILPHEKHQQPQLISIPVVSKVLPPISSGVDDHQMEPPSNQNHGRDFYHNPPFVEEERDMVGMKRPCPFYFDGVSAPMPCKIPSPSGLVKTNGSQLSANDAICCDNKANPFSYWRASGTAFSKIKEKESSSDAGFLNLGATLAFFAGQPELMPASQIHDYRASSFESCHARTSDGGSSTEPLYSFLPAGPINSDRYVNESKLEVSDDIDLDLKL